jgi:hypothetical protein
MEEEDTGRERFGSGGYRKVEGARPSEDTGRDWDGCGGYTGMEIEKCIGYREEAVRDRGCTEKEE